MERNILTKRSSVLFLLHRKVLLCNKKPSGQDRTAAVGDHVAEATRRRQRIPRAGFFLAIVLTKFAGMGDFILYPITDQISHAYEGSSLLVNYILSGPQLLVLLVSFAMPALALRFSKRSLLIAGTGAFAAGGILALIFPSALWMAAMRTLMGVGQGIIGIVSVTLIVDIYVDEEQRTKYIGIFNAFQNLAAMVLSICSGALAGAGWKQPFLLYWIGVPMVLTAVFFIPKMDNGRLANPLLNSDKISLRLGEEFWKTTGIYFIFCVMRTVLLYFMSSYVAENGLGGSGLTAMATSMSQLFAFAGAMSFSFLYQYMKKKTMPAACLLMAAAYLLWTNMIGSATVFITYCLVCGSSGLFMAYCYARPMEIIKNRDLDTAISVLSAVAGVATFVTTYFVSGIMSVIKAETFTEALPVLSVVTCVMLGLSVIIVLQKVH